MLWLIVQKISLLFSHSPPPPPAPHHTTPHPWTQPAALWINRTAAMLPAAAAAAAAPRRLPLNRRKDPSREFPTTRYSWFFTFATQNSHEQWVTLQNETHWQGVFGRGGRVLRHLSRCDAAVSLPPLSMADAKVAAFGSPESWRDE